MFFSPVRFHHRWRSFCCWVLTVFFIAELERVNEIWFHHLRRSVADVIWPSWDGGDWIAAISFFSLPAAFSKSTGNCNLNGLSCTILIRKIVRIPTRLMTKPSNKIPNRKVIPWILIKAKINRHSNWLLIWIKSHCGEILIARMEKISRENQASEMECEGENEKRIFPIIKSYLTSVSIKNDFISFSTSVYVFWGWSFARERGGWGKRVETEKAL